MRNNKTLKLFYITILIFSLFTGCGKASQNDVLSKDSNATSGDIPEDLRLTIYYMDPRILTRMPLDVDSLIGFPETRKIVIEHEELLPHLDSLKELTASMFHPAKEESYYNARMYYVLENGHSEKLLEVIISQVYGNVVVNGTEVEDYSLFYEWISPFLPEEARTMYGVQ